MRYHISLKNEVVPCYAKIKCRRSRPEEHFDTKEEALVYVDKVNELESDYISISRQEPYITKKISDIVDKIDSCYLDGLEYIKKENIGLIEVMGLAILPPRLKDELLEVEKYLLNQYNEIADYHKDWADEIKKRTDITLGPTFFLFFSSGLMPTS